MFCSVKKFLNLISVFSVVFFLTAPKEARAASFDIFKAGSAIQLGSFIAPAGGGVVSSMSVNVSGLSFDVLGTGMQAPMYNLANNDLRGTGSSMGAAYNSIASGICGIGECAFSFFSIYDPLIPGEWYVDKVLPLGEQESISLGYYEIQPSAIPLPTSILLFASALIGLMYMHKHRSRV